MKTLATVLTKFRGVPSKHAIGPRPDTRVYLARAAGEVFGWPPVSLPPRLPPLICAARYTPPWAPGVFRPGLHPRAGIVLANCAGALALNHARRGLVPRRAGRSKAAANALGAWRRHDDATIYGALAGRRVANAVAFPSGHIHEEITKLYDGRDQLVNASSMHHHAGTTAGTITQIRPKSWRRPLDCWAGPLRARRTGSQGETGIGWQGSHAEQSL